MLVATGKYGAINGMSTVRQWSISDTGETKSYVASNTRGGTGRKRGNYDWSGNANCYGGLPAVLPGETLDFEGYTAPESGEEGGDGAVYSGDAICDQVVITWNWTAADLLSHTVNFSGDGALANAVTAAILDETFPDAPSIIEYPMFYGEIDAASGAFVELEEVQTATLTITTANQSYVNSSTDGNTKRKPGNVDWTLAVVLHNDAGVHLPFTKGESYGFHLPVPDATQPWVLHWGILREITGITIDRESGAMISCTCNFEMNGFDDENEEVGVIETPDGAQYWPIGS